MKGLQKARSAAFPDDADAATEGPASFLPGSSSAIQIRHTSRQAERTATAVRQDCTLGSTVSGRGKGSMWVPLMLVTSVERHSKEGRYVPLGSLTSSGSAAPSPA